MFSSHMNDYYEIHYICFSVSFNLKNVKISDQGPAIAGTAGLVFVTKFGWKTRQVENTASGQFRQ